MAYKGDSCGIDLHQEALDEFEQEAKLHKKRMVTKRVSVGGNSKFKEYPKDPAQRYRNDNEGKGN